MTRIATPLFFHPLMVERVWGGNRLADLFGKPVPAGQRIGESWELSDRPKEQTQIVGGPFDGATLSELRERAPEAVLGKALHASGAQRFPLLVKFIDARQDLSVQVHPDDDGCRAMGIADRGKSECWVIVEAEPGARIQRGVRPGVTRKDFEQALAAGRVEDVLHFFPARAGDCVAIPPGTVHAIGAGIVLAEIQQSSDVTFRVHDYNRKGLDGRPRPLHVKESLQTIRFGTPATGYFEGDMAAETVAGTLVNLGDHARMHWLLKGRYFDLQRGALSPNARIHPPRSAGTPIILVALAGEGMLGGRAFRAGQTVLLPADLEPESEAAVLSAAGSRELVWLQSAPTPEA